MTQEILEKTREFLVIVEDLLKKADLDLLEEEPAYKFEDDFYVYFAQTVILTELDEISNLEFKKIFATRLTRWRIQTSSVYRFMPKGQGLKLLQPRKQYLQNLLQRHMVTPTNGGVILTGKPFSARELLRSIISNSDSEVSIIDTYLHPQILQLLSEILENKPNLKFKIITHPNKNNRLTDLEINLRVFVTQYPNAILIANKNSTVPHDRYIVIDGTRLFHFGLSFHDLGRTRISSWTEKIEQKEVVDTIRIINDSLSTGIPII